VPRTLTSIDVPPYPSASVGLHNCTTAQLSLACACKRVRVAAKRVAATEFRDVKVSYTALADADVDLKPREKLYYTTITGPNREGVVNDLTNYLAGSNIDVVEVQTDTYRAPMTGAKMFKLHVTCSIPTEMDENTETGCTISKEFFDNVNEGLQDLGDALGFEVETLQLDEGVFGLYRR